jgi:farnesyl-diphosphate farnesyltransferase
VPDIFASEREWLTTLLRPVSRSFYLTLRVLPRNIRPQIALAYLLARTTDTIADTDIVPAEQRLAALQQLRERILGTGRAALDFGALARQQGSAAERTLLARVEDSLAALRTLTPDDLARVREVLDIITSGQVLDLRRFAGASAAKIVALQTEAELDDYTYRVAGCVGEFWTRMCVAHLFRLPELEGLATPAFEALGVRFGKGLQLVNILRDVPADLRKGRCYLPQARLAETGLAPADLLQPIHEPRFRPLYNHFLDVAESHLAAGWEYTNRIPFTWARLRLACAWPILIGFKTIGRLRAARVLDPQARVKISRAEVRSLIARSAWRYPFPGAWRRLVTLPPDAGKAVASRADLT